MSQEAGPDEQLAAHWRALVDAVTHAQDQIGHALELSGVAVHEFSVLHQLLHAADHRMSMTHLANGVSITPGGFSKLADRMGRDGLIDRRGSTGDRRVVFVTLTDAGLTAAREAEARYLGALREHVLDLLPPAQLEAVAQTLSILDGPAETGDAAAPGPQPA